MGTWHEWPIRVYYEDTDAEGVVYFANYFKFMERGRTEWLRALGVEQDLLRAEHSLCFTVTGTHAKFHRPARFNEELVVCTRCEARGRARFTLAQDIRRNGERLASGGCVVVGVDAESFRPRRLPGFLMRRIAAGMQDTRIDDDG